jgi:hypothetical protein
MEIETNNITEGKRHEVEVRQVGEPPTGQSCQPMAICNALPPLTGSGVSGTAP